jgi:hypothetical protein
MLATDHSDWQVMPWLRTFIVSVRIGKSKFEDGIEYQYVKRFLLNDTSPHQQAKQINT